MEGKRERGRERWEGNGKGMQWNGMSMNDEMNIYD